jgi:tRNA threonylcarbamoyladenosine biosynthesis protein TsaB
MAILGISSATKTISVGLVKEQKILAELTLAGQEAFTEDLILYIDKLITESKAKLEGIAAVVGPGAYSGLRGGLATAKTLAQTLNLRIAPVSTLEAIAYNLLDQQGTLVALTSATREDYNVALFTACQGKVSRLTEDLVLSAPRLIELLSAVTGTLYLVGQTEEIYAKVQAAHPETRIICAHPQSSHPRGGLVALIGEKLIAKGETLSPFEILPKYSHQPNIREFKA